jgi:hypothetical protein
MELKRLMSWILLLFATIQLSAQADSLKLTCPLANGTIRIIRASDKDYQKSSEYGVMLTSKIDTLVNAVHEASVLIVAKQENARYDVVLQYKNYFFWYTEVLSPKVRTGVKVKAGDVIGTYKQGDLLELLMFQQEEPVNPRKYLKCN